MKRSLLVLVFLWSWPAHAALLALSGPIDRVVASGPLVAVIRENEVRVLDEDGRTVLRLGGEEAGAARTGAAP